MIKTENGMVGSYPVWGDKDARENLPDDKKEWLEEVQRRVYSSDLIPTHPFEFVADNPWENPKDLEGFEVRPFRAYGPAGKRGRENLEVVLFEVIDDDGRVAIAVNVKDLTIRS